MKRIVNIIGPEGNPRRTLIDHKYVCPPGFTIEELEAPVVAPIVEVKEEKKESKIKEVVKSVKKKISKKA